MHSYISLYVNTSLCISLQCPAHYCIPVEAVRLLCTLSHCFACHVSPILRHRVTCLDISLYVLTQLCMTLHFTTCHNTSLQIITSSFVSFVIITSCYMSWLRSEHWHTPGNTIHFTRTFSHFSSLRLQLINPNMEWFCTFIAQCSLIVKETDDIQPGKQITAR